VDWRGSWLEKKQQKYIGYKWARGNDAHADMSRMHVQYVGEVKDKYELEIEAERNAAHMTS